MIIFVAGAAVSLVAATSASAATIAVTTTGEDQAADSSACSLREAIIAANRASARGGCSAGAPGGPNTIVLQAKATYVLAQPDQPEAGHVDRASWYGPNGLPPIASTIVIEGNGATIARSSAPGTSPFRIFYVGANPAASTTASYVSPGAGNLTLQDVTLSNGLAQGGSSGAGGGGAGMGGAIFNQGALTLDAVTLSGNHAQGGSSGVGTAASGGGIGSDAGTTGGGFGPGSFGGPTGGTANMPAQTGGGGAGFATGENGANATGTLGSGAGGGPTTGTGGTDQSTTVSPSGDGSGGGGNGCTGGAPGNGGAFSAGGGEGNGPGGGGVGGGGGGVPGGQGGYAAGGGFGGGGGGLANYTDCASGGGGFGGGGGGGGKTTAPAAPGGFGAGAGGIGPGAKGGGGAGMGGAIFNQQGIVSITNSTLAANAAAGGTGVNAGSGLGGAIFNLSGSMNVFGSTLASNGAPQGGGAIYNLVYDRAVARASGATLRDSILFGNTGPDDAISDKPGTVSGGGTNQGTASVDLASRNIVATLAPKGGGEFSGTPVGGDPQLGPLKFNGGPGMATMAIAAGGAAARQGTSCLALDERGIGRPATGCDLGAFEIARSPSLASLTIRPRSVPAIGRRVKGRCHTMTRRNRAKPRCRLPIRLKVSYSLDVQATVTFTVKRQATGRRVRGRCVAQTKRNRKHKRCTRLVAVRGAITITGSRGANSFTFNGLIGGKRLAPGTYQIVAKPASGGVAGTTRSTKFTLR